MDASAGAELRSQIVAQATARARECAGVTSTAAPAALLALVAMQSIEVVNAVLLALNAVEDDSDDSGVSGAMIDVGCVIVQQPPTHQRMVIASLFHTPGVEYRNGQSRTSCNGFGRVTSASVS